VFQQTSKMHSLRCFPLKPFPLGGISTHF